MQSATRWLLVVLWMAVVFAASSLPGSAVPGRWSVSGHAVEYAVLGALIARAAWPTSDARRAVAVAICMGSLYGVTDELHQLLVPGRMSDPMDWAVDTIAAAAGALVFVWIAARVDRGRTARQ